MLIPVNKLPPWTIVKLHTGDLALSPNRASARNRYVFRYTQTHGIAQRATDTVEVVCWPAAAAFDELMRLQDRECNDGSHI